MTEDILRIAVQKSGRLNKKSLELLSKCGFQFETRPNQLLCRAEGYPFEMLLVRDDDIPEYVSDGVCQVGIVGRNVFHERILIILAGQPLFRYLLPMISQSSLKLGEANLFKLWFVFVESPSILGTHFLGI